MQELSGFAVQYSVPMSSYLTRDKSWSLYTKMLNLTVAFAAVQADVLLFFSKTKKYREFKRDVIDEYRLKELGRGKGKAHSKKWQ